jgi:L-fuculose-phosphate aldolase
VRFEFLPPNAQIAALITRIYEQGLTTTSGGNISMLDADGSIWITPAGIDKGRLQPHDIVRVLPDQTIEGHHRPSSEYPFHRMIYAARPDLRALVHAHPPALVAFSIVRKLPSTRINPQASAICGQVGYAPYALPGSEALGDSIARTFRKGHHVVMLENHGVVAGGPDLRTAFQRFETLEFCAHINLLANALGRFETLTEAQAALFDHRHHYLEEFDVGSRTSRELELRQVICEFIHRAYRRRLMISTGGTVSARIDERSFVITPFGFDRASVQPEDLVLIKAGRRERGRLPSRAVRLHSTIYEQHPQIGCVMTAQPPHATAYSISPQKFDTRTIPETFIVLRDVPIAPYGLQYEHPEALANMVTPQTPVILLRNDAVLATGADILQTFDRLEVAEFSAQALINARQIGELKPIGPQDLEDLKTRFFL